MKTPAPIERAALHVIALDGESIREGVFPSVEAAWERNEDMGSRWFFYPMRIVTGPARSDRARVLSVPDGMNSEWVGRTLGRVKKALAANQDTAIAYLEGKQPFDVMP